MAEERTFTQGETYALVADGIERETAVYKAKVTELEAQNITLGNEKDVLEQRVTAAEEKAEQAAQALDDYKAEQEARQVAEAKRDERLAKLAEVAPKLAEGISEERSNRLVAMADDEFDDHLAQLREIAGDQTSGKPEGEKPKGDATTGALPRESAAFKGGGKGGDATKPSVGGMFKARAAVNAPATRAS